MANAFNIVLRLVTSKREALECSRLQELGTQKPKYIINLFSDKNIESVIIYYYSPFCIRSTRMFPEGMRRI
jgi:hypothetical protein